MPSGRLPKSPSSSAASKQHAFWLFALALAAATLLAYFPAWNGKPIWDDDGHITRPELRAVHGLVEIWTTPSATQQYYPLVHSVFWLEHRLWHDVVLPYHLVNIFLHVASALLLVIILQRLKLPGAWLAAAIFALHPVHVESVAWISELKNTLSGFFFLSAAVVYLDFDKRGTRWLYLGALFLFTLGLLSKSVVAALPAALLVVFWWERGAIRWKRDVLPLLPFFGLGLAAGLVTMWMEKTQIGASGSDFEFSFLARCLIAGRAVCFYLTKLFFPIKLTFIYPRWEIDQSVWWQYLFPISVIVLAIACCLGRKRTRGPLAALLLFVGVLFPALGFVNVYPFIFSFVADHFQYLASIAVIAFTASCLTQLFSTFRVAGYRPLCGALLAGLAFLTWQQARTYADAETLYRATLDRNPACWMAHNNLANILARTNRTEQAVGHYREALELRPRYLEARYSLGNALMQRGEVDEGIEQCELALAIKPDSVEAHNNLANGLRQKGDNAEAIKHYEAALRIQPEAIPTKNNLAWILATSTDKTLRDLPRAIALAGEANEQSGGKNPIVLRTLSAALVQSGQLVHGRALAQSALALSQAQGKSDLVPVLQRDIAQLDSIIDQDNQ